MSHRLSTYSQLTEKSNNSLVPLTTPNKQSMTFIIWRHNTGSSSDQYQLQLANDIDFVMLAYFIKCSLMLCSLCLFLVACQIAKKCNLCVWLFCPIGLLLRPYTDWWSLIMSFSIDAGQYFATQSKSLGLTWPPHCKRSGWCNSSHIMNRIRYLKGNEESVVYLYYWQPQEVWLLLPC